MSEKDSSLNSQIFFQDGGKFLSEAGDLNVTGGSANPT